MMSICILFCYWIAACIALTGFKRVRETDVFRNLVKEKFCYIKCQGISNFPYLFIY